MALKIQSLSSRPDDEGPLGLSGEFSSPSLPPLGSDDDAALAAEDRGARDMASLLHGWSLYCRFLRFVGEGALIPERADDFVTDLRRRLKSGEVAERDTVALEKWVERLLEYGERKTVRSMREFVATGAFDRAELIAMGALIVRGSAQGRLGVLIPIVDFILGSNRDAPSLTFRSGYERELEALSSFRDGPPDKARIERSLHRIAAFKSKIASASSSESLRSEVLLELVGFRLSLGLDVIDPQVAKAMEGALYSGRRALRAKAGASPAELDQTFAALEEEAEAVWDSLHTDDEPEIVDALAPKAVARGGGGKNVFKLDRRAKFLAAQVAIMVIGAIALAIQYGKLHKTPLAEMDAAEVHALSDVLMSGHINTESNPHMLVAQVDPAKWDKLDDKERKKALGSLFAEVAKKKIDNIQILVDTKMVGMVIGGYRINTGEYSKDPRKGR